jgi:hypothetical protein
MEVYKEIEKKIRREVKLATKTNSLDPTAISALLHHSQLLSQSSISLSSSSTKNPNSSFSSHFFDRIRFPFSIHSPI